MSNKSVLISRLGFLGYTLTKNYGTVYLKSGREFRGRLALKVALEVFILSEKKRVTHFFLERKNTHLSCWLTSIKFDIWVGKAMMARRRVTRVEGPLIMFKLYVSTETRNIHWHVVERYDTGLEKTTETNQNRKIRIPIKYLRSRHLHILLDDQPLFNPSTAKERGPILSNWYPKNKNVYFQII